MNHAQNRKDPRWRAALTIVISFGIISMLGDMVHESARSVNGQYLSLIGVTATQVGLVFGIGEFLGYALRLLSGSLLDKTGKHWLFMFIGYGLHIVIPFMGVTQNWNFLLVFILLERIGKALRSPAKDTILSGVSENQIGLGYAFGLQEALDQLGAFLGPLIFTAVFYFVGDSGLSEFQLGYQLLVIPFLVLMGFLYYVYRKFTEQDLTPISKKPDKNEPLQPIFWYYSAFTFFAAFGLVNFGIIGYHLKVQNVVDDKWIPILYAGAMAIDALIAILIGKSYDRLKVKTNKKTGGILILLIIPLFTLLLPTLTLTYSITLLIIGMVLMGIILGAHETVMKSAIADLTPFHKRGIGYGLFNTFYGLALLAGSSLMGYLYDHNQLMLISILTAVSELIAIGWYLKLRHTIRKN